MSDFSLSGKRIAVTGGFGVLGQAVGLGLQQAGAQVMLLDKAGEAPPMPAGLLSLAQVDLSQADAAQAALDQVAQRLGGLDGLVNVAGGFRWEEVATGSIETWDLLYGMNLRTAVLASQAALPHLLRQAQARIVNVSALASGQAASGMGAYAASKAGVSRLTEALAEELKDRAITVNAVLPSILDTPTNRADMPQADASRWVQPSALAAVIAFLLSDAAAAVTGALIPVRGRV